jgi:hypothetical protein
MKKIIRLILLSFSFFEFCLSGCNKDEVGNNNPIDTIRPVITLNGNAVIDVILNDAFIDPGATAFDNGIQISVIPAGTVDVNHTGYYGITYSAIDASNNMDIIGRSVHVYNQAEIFAGNYIHCNDTCTISPQSSFSALVTESNTVNKQIRIDNFGAFGTNIHVIAMISANSNGSPISIQSGQSLGGTALIQNIFQSETNVISAAIDSTSFKVKYQWVDAGDSDVCTSTYIR